LDILHLLKKIDSSSNSGFGVMAIMSNFDASLWKWALRRRKIKIFLKNNCVILIHHILIQSYQTKPTSLGKLAMKSNIVIKLSEILRSSGNCT